MRYPFVLFLLIMVCFFGGCHYGQIRVPVSDAQDSELVWRDRLDADVFAEKSKSLRLSFDTAVLGAARVGPAVEFKRSAVHKWNENVATVNTMYRALANDWNSGLLSLERFNRKRDEIDELYSRLAKEKEELRNTKNAKALEELVNRARERTQKAAEERDVP